MPSGERGDRDSVELLQGALDLIVLRALHTMGPLHAYGLAARLEQVADDPFVLNQGTLYPALVQARAARAHQGNLAEDRVQSRREVLSHHEIGDQRRRASHSALASPRGTGRETSSG